MRWRSVLVVVACGLPVACGEPPVEGDGVDESGEAETEADADTEADTNDDEIGDETGTDTDGGCNGPWDQGYALEMPELPDGDPGLGFEALLTEGYVSCGIPWTLWGLAQGGLGSLAQGDPLPGRTGKNAEVPYSWNVVELGDGSEMVVTNCFSCHAGEFNGELVLGLGTTTADWTTSVGSLVSDLPPLPELTEAAARFNLFIERYGMLAPYSQMATIGANPAIMFAIVLLAHRDPFTLAWLDEPNFELFDHLIIPADPPPWWRTSKKATHFTNGMSRGDHRGTMILASSLCTDTAAEAAEMLDYFADIQAYLVSLEAPAYPFAIDESLASDGEAIFECECAGCHGTYDADPANESYPNLLIPYEVVGTDASYAIHASDGGVYNGLQDWFNMSYYGTVSEVATDQPFPGYTAPPLDGIWATAPFLHNGSVPTLELVLDSEARPTYWRRIDYDSTHYDQGALGWPFETLAFGHSEAAPDERSRIYDTTLFGYGNGGHTFGDHLTDDERSALLEYLKTL